MASNASDLHLQVQLGIDKAFEECRAHVRHVLHAALKEHNLISLDAPLNSDNELHGISDHRPIPFVVQCGIESDASDHTNEHFDLQVPRLCRSMTQLFEEQEKKRLERAKSYVTHLRPSQQRGQPIATSLSHIQDFVRSRMFQYLTALLIISNAVVVGVQVDTAFGMQQQLETMMVFQVTHYFYCGAFSLELVLRMLEGGYGFFWSQGCSWNYLDMSVVLICILELFIGIFQFALSSTLEHLSVLRLVRIIRLLRLMRLIRLISFFKSLRILVSSILLTLRALMWAMVLLVLIIYIFAIVFAQAALDHQVHHGWNAENLDFYYGSVLRTIYTLFQSMCGGLNWGEAILPLFGIHRLFAALFICYIVVVYFAVANVVTGVFCQNAIESAAQDKDEVFAEQMRCNREYLAKLQELFGNMSGATEHHPVSYNEFSSRFDDEELRSFFALLDMDIKDAWTLFKLLDTDESQHIDLQEFVDGCLRLRGPAKSIELAKMSYEIRFMMNHISGLLVAVEDLLAHTGSTIVSRLPRPGVITHASASRSKKELLRL